MKYQILNSPAVPNVPWRERPADFSPAIPIWRYEENPIINRNPIPGGMLTLGIPSFRLERDVVNAEIDVLRQMGVKFECGVEIGKAPTR